MTWSGHAGASHPAGRPTAGAGTTFDDTAVGELERNGLHIDQPGAPVDDSDSDAEHLRRFGTLEDHIDAFVEAFNAHDLDYLVEVLAEDVELPGLGKDLDGFPDAVHDVWDRRPNAVLTRGLLDDVPVAVVWDVGDTSAWDRIALLSFDAANGEGHIGVVEVIEDPQDVTVAETVVPDDDAPEASTWAEWYEGADGS